MFSGVSQLSEPNKLLIHASFVAQAPSVWKYNWGPGYAIPGGVFDRSSLQDALSKWCANAAEAAETLGHVSTWDVRRITDMSGLIYDGGAPCRSTFNEDLNAWDVSQVTSMAVRRRPALRHGHRVRAHGHSGLQ